MLDEKKLQPPQSVSVEKFFESVPPGKEVLVANVAMEPLLEWKFHDMRATSLRLHCESEYCKGIRYFGLTGAKPNFHFNKLQVEHFVTFACQNCKRFSKTFAIRSSPLSIDNCAMLMKFGEFPPFGPPTPARVITLIGGEREYFLKGRRAENQGLGIAAFAYYRRVVENQKTKIIEEITRVAERVGASPETLADLKAASVETQFTKAVDAIKHGIPESLLIDGHNPLALLHSALSEGLHAQTDDQCLELAVSIRVVLTALVEKMGVALQEEQELNSAVNRLLKASSEKKSRG
jgi:hypothetical protein